MASERFGSSDQLSIAAASFPGRRTAVTGSTPPAFFGRPRDFWFTEIDFCHKQTRPYPRSTLWTLRRGAAFYPEPLAWPPVAPFWRWRQFPAIAGAAAPAGVPDPVFFLIEAHRVAERASVGSDRASQRRFSSIKPVASEPSDAPIRRLDMPDKGPQAPARSQPMF
jgi:hypothetical protein